MADRKSTILAGNLLSFLTGDVVSLPNTAGSVFIALSSTLPATDGSNFTEIPGSTGYARVAYPLGTAYWSEPSARQIHNQQDVTFNDALEIYPSVVAFALYDAPTAGNILYYGHIDLARSIGVGDNFNIPPGKLTISETKSDNTLSKKSDYLANAQLKLLRSEIFETPSQVFLALGSDLVSTNTPTTGDIKEFDATTAPGYLRLPIPCDGSNWSITGRDAVNLLVLIFEKATADWPQAKSYAVYKTATGMTSLLYANNFDNSKSVVLFEDDKLKIGINSITISE